MAPSSSEQNTSFNCYGPYVTYGSVGPFVIFRATIEPETPFAEEKERE